MACQVSFLQCSEDYCYILIRPQTQPDVKTYLKRLKTLFGWNKLLKEVA